MSMRDIAAARAHGPEAIANVEAARSRTSKAFQEALLEDCNHCLAALDALDKAVDARIEADGPSFSGARTALQDLAHFVTPAAGAAAVVPVTAVGGVSTPVAVLPAAAGMPVLAGAISSRAQALGQLRMVADYFRQTEPHSPVAYLADKAAMWGEQPLHLWLKTVVKDAGALAHVEEMLGIVKEEG
jgi:type VI secretion system protein ImpA